MATLTTKSEKIKENPVKQFMFDYFNNIDFDYWEKRINFSLDKIRKLKKNKSRSYYLIDIYSIYLQLLEIFFVNILILSVGEDGFLSILFASNTELKEMIKKQFSDPQFITWFMDSYVFGFKDKTQINNYTKKRQDHEQILKEATEDYLKDFEFLNSYKHGFRVQAHSGGTLSIEKMVILVADTELTYFTKESLGKGKGIVHRNIIMFNQERVFTKCYFILGMLKNSQKVFLAKGKAIKLDHYFLTDLNKWQGSVGKLRFKVPLFNVSK